MAISSYISAIGNWLAQIVPATPEPPAITPPNIDYYLKSARIIFDGAMNKNFSCGKRALGLNANIQTSNGNIHGVINVVDNQFAVPVGAFFTTSGIYVNAPGPYNIYDPGIHRTQGGYLCAGGTPGNALKRLHPEYQPGSFYGKCFHPDELPSVVKMILNGATLPAFIEEILNQPTSKPMATYTDKCWLDSASHTGMDITKDLVQDPQIKIEVSELSKLVLPRILSLGKTSFDVHVSFPHTAYQNHLKRPEIWLNNLSMQVEPTVYAKNEAGESTLAILGGHIWAEDQAEVVFSQDGRHLLSFVPGLKIDGNPEIYFRPNINGSVSFNLDLLTPFGQVNLSGSLLINTTLVLAKDGVGLLHEETYLQLKDLRLLKANGDPVFENLNIILTDLPHFGGPLPPTSRGAEQPGFSLTFTADDFGNQNRLYARLNLPLWPNQKEFLFPDDQGFYQTTGPYRVYDLKNLLDSLRIDGYLEYVSKGGSWEGVLKTQPMSLDENPLLPFDSPADSTTAHHYQLDFAFSKTTPTGEKAFEQSGGRVYLGFGKNGGNESIFNLRGNIDQLNIGNYLRINNIGTSVRINQAKLGEHTAAVTIQEFDVWANQAGSDLGLVRGPINLRLNDPQRPLQINWNSHEKTLNFQGLDFPFSVQGFHLPIFPKKSSGRVFAAGIDGRLIGNCNQLFYSLDHFVGDCQIALVGNQQYLKTPEGEYVETPNGTKVPNPYYRDPRFDPHQGDIYLLNQPLKKVGPPIIRNAQWTASYFGEKPHPKAPLEEWKTGLPKMKEVLTAENTWMPSEEAQNLGLSYSKEREVLKGYLLGAYLLIIDINTIPLAPFGAQVKFDGTARMRHQDMYILVPRGIQTREADYLKFLWDTEGR